MKVFQRTSEYDRAISNYLNGSARRPKAVIA